MKLCPAPIKDGVLSLEYMKRAIACAIAILLLGGLVYVFFATGARTDVNAKSGESGLESSPHPSLVTGGQVSSLGSPVSLALDPVQSSKTLLDELLAAKQPWNLSLRRQLSALPISELVDLLSTPGLAGTEDADQLLNRVLMACGNALGSAADPATLHGVVSVQCSSLFGERERYLGLLGDATQRLAENDNALYRTIPMTDTDRELVMDASQRRISSGNPELVFIAAQDLVRADAVRYLGDYSHQATAMDRAQFGFALAMVMACRVEGGCGAGSLWTLQFCARPGMSCAGNQPLEAEVHRNLSAAQREAFMHGLDALAKLPPPGN